MLRLLADENFSGDVVRGLLRLRPDLELVRVQDVGLQAADDPSILAWAAEHDRIVLSHDRSTLPDFAFERVTAEMPMPGLFIFSNRMTVRQSIDELLVCHDCSEQATWSDVVLYFPL